jgi:two-component system, cell cycle sensor histidine kinase and response regulator CckA
MPTGGSFILESKEVTPAEDFCRLHPDLIPGKYVLLRVSDTGHGMDQETSEHIFEPFFTTKSAGEGTGLGLASVYGTVKQSDGYIYVSTEPGKGSIFSIYFPSVSTAVDQEAPVPRIQTRGTGHETVLIIEDEPAIRNLFSLSLRGHGYKVLEAGDGNEALRVVGSAGCQCVDVVVTDVVMPNMGGTVFIRRLEEKHAAVKVIFMSGYADETINRHGVDLSGHIFLQKPFSPDVLVSAIRNALDR